MAPRVLIGKALGARIGDMGKPLRDGDGDGRCQEHDGNFIPCPPGVGTGSIIGNLAESIDELDGIDLEELGIDPDEGYYELEEMVRDDWTQWKECRSIRKEAYKIAGGNPSPADPHVSRRGRNLFGDPQHAAHMREENQTRSSAIARFLMNRLGSDAQSGETDNDPLFRAVMLAEDSEDDFYDSFSEGKIVDIPLIATATADRLGANPFLTRYGSDALIKIEGPRVGYQSDSINTLAGQDLEDETIQTLLDLADEFEGDEDVSEDLPQMIRDAVDAYETALKDGTISDIRQAKADLAYIIDDNGLLENYFFAGDQLDEGDPTYWDQIEGDSGVREIITGGRFVVKSVEDDRLGVYRKIITLQHVGVFDPRTPGAIIPIKKGA